MLNQKNTNLLKLALIVAVFISPLIAANLYYYYGYAQGGLTNQGELLSGQDNIAELKFDTETNNNPNIDEFSHKQWHVLYFVDDTCDSDCQKTLYKLQQVHIALGKNVHRFSRTIVHSSVNDVDWEPIYIKYPHMTAVYAQKANSSLSKENLYIADPLGNIILSYKLQDNDFDKKIFKDMKKLLNVSKIG